MVKLFLLYFINIIHSGKKYESVNLQTVKTEFSGLDKINFHLVSASNEEVGINPGYSCNLRTDKINFYFSQNNRGHYITDLKYEIVEGKYRNCSGILKLDDGTEFEANWQEKYSLKEQKEFGPREENYIFSSGLDILFKLKITENIKLNWFENNENIEFFWKVNNNKFLVSNIMKDYLGDYSGILTCSDNLKFFAEWKTNFWSDRIYKFFSKM